MTLKVLGGHEGPVSCLSFSPVQAVLASSSWDRTVRLWDMIDSWRAKETLLLPADGETNSQQDAAPWWQRCSSSL